MEKKKRIFLFLIFVFLFFVLTPLAICYSLGYRIDIKNRKIVKTGGIYLKAKPPGAKVFLNKKYKGKTSPIFGTIFIKNLFPQKYEIRVEKEGYFAWEKKLKVKEEKVQRAIHIILIPKNLKWEKIPYSEKIPEIFATTTKNEEGIYHLNEKGYLFEGKEKLWEKSFQNFVVSPDFKKIALTTEHEIWLLVLKPEPQKIFLTRFSKKIGEIFWYGENYLIFKVGEGEIKITEIDDRDKLNIYDLAEFEGKTKIFFDQKTQFLYVLNKGNLLFTDDLRQ